MEHVKAVASIAAHKTLNRTLALLMAVLGFWAVTTYLPIAEQQVPHPTPVEVEVVDVPSDRLVRIMDRRSCWTGEQEPKVEGFPGHVLFTDGTVGGPRVVGQALDEIFEGKDHDLKPIYAFCR